MISRTCLVTAMAIVAFGTHAAWGQATGFPSPPDPIKTSVSTVNKDHKRVLSDQGQALEVPVKFFMVERDSVAIEAALGEEGRFDIELLSGNRAVELKDVRVEEGLGKAEVVRKVKPMSSADLRDRRDEQLDELAGKNVMERTRKEAGNSKPDDMRRYIINSGFGDPRGDNEEGLRALFARVKAFEGKADVLRKQLNAAADANPRRYTTQERKAWEAMKFGELLVYYRKILQTELAEEHLKQCGLDFDRSTRAAAEKVIPMFLAMHSLMTKQEPESEEDKRAAKEALSGGSAGVIRQALTVELRLRLYSESGSADPNAQWFNAQRVACRAVGANSIRVEGTLDPDKGDSVDWWILDKWDPGSVQFTSSTEGGVQFDPPKVEDNVAKLRVAAGKKAAKYWFEMRVDKGGELKIVVHESHIPAESKFPY